MSEWFLACLCVKAGIILMLRLGGVTSSFFSFLFFSFFTRQPALVLYR